MWQLQDRGETKHQGNELIVCFLQVAMYDTDEVYHFFNVVASHTWFKPICQFAPGKLHKGIFRALSREKCWPDESEVTPII